MTAIIPDHAPPWNTFWTHSESPFQPAPNQKRNYDDLFFYNAARYIHWELNLIHPAPGQRTSFTIEEVWQGPQGVSHREARVFTLEADWTSSFFTSSARLVGTKTVDTPNPLYDDCLRRQRRSGVWGEPCSPTMPVDIQNWPRGTYQVDLFVEKQRVATGWFSMLVKEQIYGEVQAKTLDRSAPTGAIASLKAEVASLRFFEAGATSPPRAQRGYATQFPLATTRNIVWEVDLRHAAPGRWVPVTFEALLYLADAGGERVVQRKVLQSAVPADWSDTYHLDHFGWYNDYYYDRAGSTTSSPRRWLPGSYRVDLYVANRMITSGSFEMR